MAQARWTTASAPANAWRNALRAPALPTSTETHSAASYGAAAGGRRRAMPTSSCRPANRRSRAVPALPEAPVMTMRTSLGYPDARVGKLAGWVRTQHGSIRSADRRSPGRLPPQAALRLFAAGPPPGPWRRSGRAGGHGARSVPRRPARLRWSRRPDLLGRLPEEGRDADGRGGRRRARVLLDVRQFVVGQG